MEQPCMRVSVRVCLYVSKGTQKILFLIHVQGEGVRRWQKERKTPSPKRAELFISALCNYG